jgi:hypothetical protein
VQTRETSEAGLIELQGNNAIWIWAFPCPTPGCECRTATVVASGDRETLVARSAPVLEAWLGGGSPAEAAADLADVTVLALDIDDGSVFPSGGDVAEPFDFDAHPEARAVVDRIDGEALDAIGRLWYLGKGLPDPEATRLAAPQIKLENWDDDEFLAWGEALEGVRLDIYEVGGHEYEAIDIYCVAKGCDCGEVSLDFASLDTSIAPEPGLVRVARSGIATFEPAHEKHGALLEELWAAFQKRYPNYRERFARRTAIMRELSPRIVGVPRAGTVRKTAKVGRNEPCPCGSGKKYKKCCGAT